jgi:hypothetical protein
MRLFETGRWPSVVDAETLSSAITSIVNAGTEFDKRFYQDDLSKGGIACQGDVVQLRAASPMLDEDGRPIVTDTEFDQWLIVGNTCDIDREEEHYSLIAPLIYIRREVTGDELRAFRRYEYCKRFYIPPWPNGSNESHHFADFMQLVTIDKAAFRPDCARVVARLEFPAWALLNACIVRFLARGDGRFD